jgi:hypothetical protein
MQIAFKTRFNLISPIRVKPSGGRAEHDDDNDEEFNFHMHKYGAAKPVESFLVPIKVDLPPDC